jgi:hypothetical protein
MGLKSLWIAAGALAFAVHLPAAEMPAAKTTCKDGTISSASGRGACSKHGGVQASTSKPGTGSTATPGSTSSAALSSAAVGATAPAATPPPSTVAPPGVATRSKAPETLAGSAGGKAGDAARTGATAQCKDGTYSMAKSHSGACSRDGGVSQWLDTSK